VTELAGVEFGLLSAPHPAVAGGSRQARATTTGPAAHSTALCSHGQACHLSIALMRLGPGSRARPAQACTGLHRLARRNRGRAVVTAVRGSCRRASRAPAAPPSGQSRAAPLPKSQHQEAAEKGSVTGNAARWRAPSQSRSLADQIPGPRSQIPVPCCDLT
jgi:hypothetical protein